jgi:hypothetical protein
MGKKKPPTEVSWGLLLAELQLMLLLEHFGISRGVHGDANHSQTNHKGENLPDVHFSSSLAEMQTAYGKRHGGDASSAWSCLAEVQEPFASHICIAYQTQQKREEKKCTAVVANDKSDDDQAEQRLEQRPHVIVESSDLVGLVSLPEAPENGIEGHKAVVDKQVTLPD